MSNINRFRKRESENGVDINSQIKRQNDLLYNLKDHLEDKNTNNGNYMEDVVQIMQHRINQFQDHNKKKNQLSEVQEYLEGINSRFDHIQSNLNSHKQHGSLPMLNPAKSNYYNNTSFSQPNYGHNNYGQPGFSTPNQYQSQMPNYPMNMRGMDLPPQKPQAMIPNPDVLTSVLNPFRLIVPHKIYDDQMTETGETLNRKNKTPSNEESANNTGLKYRDPQNNESLKDSRLDSNKQKSENKSILKSLNESKISLKSNQNELQNNQGEHYSMKLPKKQSEVINANGMKIVVDQSDNKSLPVRSQRTLDEDKKSFWNEVFDENMTKKSGESNMLSPQKKVHKHPENNKNLYNPSKQNTNKNYNDTIPEEYNFPTESFNKSFNKSFYKSQQVLNKDTLKNESVNTNYPHKPSTKTGELKRLSTIENSQIINSKNQNVNQDYLESRQKFYDDDNRNLYNKEEDQNGFVEPPLGYHPQNGDSVGIDPNYPPHMFPFMYPHLFPHFFPGLYPFYCKNLKKVLRDKKKDEKKQMKEKMQQQMFQNMYGMLPPLASQDKPKRRKKKRPKHNKNLINPNKRTPEQLASIFRIKVHQIKAYNRVYKHYLYMINTRYNTVLHFYNETKTTISTNIENHIRDVIEDDLKELLNHEEILFQKKNEGSTRNMHLLSTIGKIAENLLSNVLKNIKTNFDRDEYILFQSYISYNFCYYPDNYALEFELNRLDFNSHGSLKIKDNNDSKMIIGCDQIIKTLVYQAILRLDDELEPLIDDPIKSENLKFLASMIYHTFFTYIKEQQPVRQQKFDFNDILFEERRIWPMGQLYTPDESNFNTKDWQDENDPIKGMIKSTDMSYFIESTHFENCKEIIKSIIDQLYIMSKTKYVDRIRSVVSEKIVKRRKLMEKCKNQMPEYCSKIKRWEENTIKKYKFEPSELKNLELNN